MQLTVKNSFAGKPPTSYRKTDKKRKKSQKMGIAGLLLNIQQMLKELLNREAAENGYFDIRRAAAYLSLSQRTVRNLVYEGKVPAYRVGGKILISLAELEAFVKRNSIEIEDIKETANKILKNLQSK